LFCLAVACSEPAPAPPVSDVASRRELSSGSVVGSVGSYGSHVWLGIPYAQPPNGGRRWRAPVPEEPWQGDLVATEFGAPCPQFASRFAGVIDVPAGTPTGNEDCLFLNVYAPVFGPEAVPNTGA
jgi:para-nitrobenzyl esterase